MPANLVWSDDAPRQQLARLYEDGKAAQWDAATDIDWTLDVDPGTGPVFATEAGAIDWATLGDPLTTAVGTEPETRRAILAQLHGWFVSQLLHGEQGALVAMAKVCAAVDSVEAKCCAALQMADEARHVEAYRRYLDKIGISYPVSGALRELLDQAVRHRSADLTYVGAQLLVESLGLAAAELGHAVFGNALLCQIISRVREDEARHVAFGAAALGGVYHQMTGAERREREDFVLEASALLRHRFRPRQVWDHFGVDAASASVCFVDSPDVAAIGALAFARIVPQLRRMGLLTPRVRQGLQAQGLLQFGGDEEIDDCHEVEADPVVPIGVDTDDPLLALRAALGCVEQIEPGPVLLAMSGLTDRARLARVPKATVRLEVTGPTGPSAWLVTVDDHRMDYRGALPADRGDVAVRMDLATWTDMVAGRVTMPVALAGGRITVAGDIFKARALEAVL